MSDRLRQIRDRWVLDADKYNRLKDPDIWAAQTEPAIYPWRYDKDGKRRTRPTDTPVTSVS